ncbi:MAG: hypothetical protein JO107_07555 [Hyphomicrobiales bacterium]|nr:hypothetical protein [Hyphomicrobiales bacterium]
MPPASAALPLQNARWEAFALARAAGLSQLSAYVRAGYGAWRTAASRLAAKPKVADRIAWLKAQAAEAVGSDSETAIVRLLDMADAAELSTAAGIRAAREALEEAWRRYEELCRSRAAADSDGRPRPR